MDGYHREGRKEYVLVVEHLIHLYLFYEELFPEFYGFLVIAYQIVPETVQ